MGDGTRSCANRMVVWTHARRDPSPHVVGTRSCAIRRRVSIKSEPRNVKAQESLARRSRRIFLAIDQSFDADFRACFADSWRAKNTYPPKYSATSVTSARAFLLLLSDKAHTWDAYSEGHLTRPLEAGARRSAPNTPGRPSHALPHKTPVARKWPVNEQSSSHYIHFGNESPVAAVEAVGTVVAQREIGPGRNSDRGFRVAKINRSPREITIAGVAVLPRFDTFESVGLCFLTVNE